MISPRLQPHADALAMANAALGINPGDESAAQTMAHALVMLGRFDDIHRLAEHLNLTAGPNAGWVCMAAALHRVLGEGRYAELIALCDTSPQENPGHIISVYFAGCARMMTGDMVAALNQFDWFRTHVRFYADHIAFVSHPLLSMIYRQGRLIAGPVEIDRRREAPTTLPIIEHLGQLAAAPPEQAAIFSCLDEHYFTLLGLRFVEANRSLNPTTPLVLHVIGPSEATRTQLAAMTTRWPGMFAASVEPSPLFSTVTYYASARYYVALQLMDHHARPMISLDGEIQVPVETLGLAKLCRNFDFACFGTGRNEPGSVWQASVMWFGRSETARRFIATLQSYCWPELSHPSLMTWQLDQAALLACRHFFDSRGLGLAFGDLRHILNMELSELISDIAPAEDKEADKHRKMSDEIQSIGTKLGELYRRL